MPLKRWMQIGVVVVLVSLVTWAARSDSEDYPYIQYDHPAIEYPKDSPDDPIARLQHKIDRGETKLAFDPRSGYLGSVLSSLGINVDSQMLVFSKTSFQAQKISPQKPRAIYFNDDVAVGFVPDGDVLEFAALDPRQGVTFYVMNRTKATRPSFIRMNEECLACHLIPGTLNVPGLLATSVIPRANGSPRFPASAVLVDSRTPLDQRWGGWFVNGNAVNVQHRGNVASSNPDQPMALDMRVDRRLDTTPYPEPASDIVALMTLEHQTRITNLLTRLGWESRIAIKDSKWEAFRGRLDVLTSEVASYMLFAGEARISQPIEGASTFSRTFPQRGPRDSKGRSLRDFDLQTRLFRYPLSYMIYDQAFNALPDQAKDQIYQKLFDVLTSTHSAGKFQTLTAQDREQILDILRETKKDLPAYWQNAAPAQ